MLSKFNPLYALSLLLLLANLMVYTPAYSKAINKKKFCSTDFKRLLIKLAKKPILNPQIRRYELDGWLNLIQIIASKECLQEKNNLFKSWLQQYSKHPAVYFFPSLFALNMNAISKVAIFLPFDKPYHYYSEKILAKLSKLFKYSSIDMIKYDTSQAQIMDIYQQALKEKVNCIIGPLRKKMISQISKQALSIPVLALNPAKNNPHSSANFFSLAKIQESEINELLSELIKNKFHRGILFYPQNNKKLTQQAVKIKQQFIEQFGEWTAIQAYDRSKTSYSELVKSTLHINKSVNRFKHLKSISLIKAEFYPRRRQDFDFIVLLGSVAEIKQIYPQIRYWYADNIPVYTTSSIASQINSSNMDYNDLSGIKYISVLNLKSNNNQLRDEKLKLIAKQAANIVRETNCLQLETLLSIKEQHKLWTFIPEKGLFIYKHRKKDS